LLTERPDLFKEVAVPAGDSVLQWLETEKAYPGVSQQVKQGMVEPVDLEIRKIILDLRGKYRK
jgi:hypothetical protein